MRKMDNQTMMWSTDKLVCSTGNEQVSSLSAGSND